MKPPLIRGTHLSAFRNIYGSRPNVDPSIHFIHSSAFQLSSSRKDLIPSESRLAKIPKDSKDGVTTKALKSIISMRDTAIKLVNDSVALIKKKEELPEMSRRELRKYEMQYRPTPKRLPPRLDRIIGDVILKIDKPSERWAEQQKAEKIETAEKSDASLFLTSFAGVPAIDSLETNRGIHGTLLPSTAKYSAPYASLPVKKEKTLESVLTDRLQERFATPTKLRLNVCWGGC